MSKNKGFVSKKLLSIVIPFYNEAGSIASTVTKLVEVIEGDFSEGILALEIILVNDGSSDGSESVAHGLVKELSSSRTKLRYIHLARNFGKEAAVYAGYSYADGDIAGCIDADGQHPPEEMSKMVSKLLGGRAQMVIGVRADQSHKRIGFASALFYRLSKKLGNKSSTVNGTDFRVVSRAVIDEFLSAKEHGRVNRDIMDWFGYESLVHEFRPLKREAGKATYSFKKLVMLAVDGLVAAGTKPLFIMFPIGLFVFLLGFSGLVFTSFTELILDDPFGLGMTAQGYALLLIVALFGMVLSVLGIIALYVGRISTEVQNRPHYVVDESRGFKS